MSHEGPRGPPSRYAERVAGPPTVFLSFLRFTLFRARVPTGTSVRPLQGGLHSRLRQKNGLWLGFTLMLGLQSFRQKGSKKKKFAKGSFFGDLYHTTDIQYRNFRKKYRALVSLQFSRYVYRKCFRFIHTH